MTPNPDLSKLSGELYRQWEKSMAQWWDQVLESPAFLNSMGGNLSAQAQARSGYEKAVDQTLEQLHLPSRTDVVRLTRIATALEDRLLGLEDRLLEMGDRAEHLEREVLKARVDAAEARVEMRERLAALEARLAELEGPATGATPDQTTRRPPPRRKES